MHDVYSVRGEFCRHPLLSAGLQFISESFNGAAENRRRWIAPLGLLIPRRKHVRASAPVSGVFAI